MKTKTKKLEHRLLYIKTMKNEKQKNKKKQKLQKKRKKKRAKHYRLLIIFVYTPSDY